MSTPPRVRMGDTPLNEHTVTLYDIPRQEVEYERTLKITAAKDEVSQ